MERRCRICGNLKEENVLVDVFDPRFSNGHNLRKYLRVVTGIHIRQDDVITKRVCSKCINGAFQCFLFRTKAIGMDKILKEKAGQVDEVQEIDCNQNIYTEVIMVSDDEENEVQAPTISSSNITEDKEAMIEEILPNESTVKKKLYINTEEIIESIDEVETSENSISLSTTDLDENLGSDEENRLLADSEDEEEVNTKETNENPILIDEDSQATIINLVMDFIEHDVEEVIDSENSNDSQKTINPEENDYFLKHTPEIIEQKNIKLEENDYFLKHTPEIIEQKNTCEDKVVSNDSDEEDDMFTAPTQLLVCNYPEANQEEADEEDSFLEDRLVIDEDCDYNEEKSPDDLTMEDTVENIINTPCVPNITDKPPIRLHQSVSELFKKYSGLELPEEALDCNWSPKLCLKRHATPRTPPFTQRRCSNYSNTSTEEDLLIESPFQKSEFVCEHCNAVFKRMHRLKQHMRGHKTCKYCKKSFNKVGSLLTHLNESCHIYTVKNFRVLVPRCDQIKDIYKKHKQAFDNYLEESQLTLATISVPSDNSKSYSVDLENKRVSVGNNKVKTLNLDNNLSKRKNFDKSLDQPCKRVQLNSETTIELEQKPQRFILFTPTINPVVTQAVVSLPQQNVIQNTQCNMSMPSLFVGTNGDVSNTNQIPTQHHVTSPETNQIVTTQTTQPQLFNELTLPQDQKMMLKQAANSRTEILNNNIISPRGNETTKMPPNSCPQQNGLMMPQLPSLNNTNNQLPMPHLNQQSQSIPITKTFQQVFTFLPGISSTKIEISPHQIHVNQPLQGISSNYENFGAFQEQMLKEVQEFMKKMNQPNSPQETNFTTLPPPANPTQILNQQSYLISPNSRASPLQNGSNLPPPAFPTQVLNQQSYLVSPNSRASPLQNGSNLPPTAFPTQVLKQQSCLTSPNSRASSLQNGSNLPPPTFPTQVLNQQSYLVSPNSRASPLQNGSNLPPPTFPTQVLNQQSYLVSPNSRASSLQNGSNLPPPAFPTQVLNLQSYLVSPNSRASPLQNGSNLPPPAFPTQVLNQQSYLISPNSRASPLQNGSNLPPPACPTQVLNQQSYLTSPNSRASSLQNGSNLPPPAFPSQVLNQQSYLISPNSHASPLQNGSNLPPPAFPTQVLNQQSYLISPNSRTSPLQNGSNLPAPACPTQVLNQQSYLTSPNSRASPLQNGSNLPAPTCPTQVLNQPSSSTSPNSRASPLQNGSSSPTSRPNISISQKLDEIKNSEENYVRNLYKSSTSTQIESPDIIGSSKTYNIKEFPCGNNQIATIAHIEGLSNELKYYPIPIKLVSNINLTETKVRIDFSKEVPATSTELDLTKLKVIDIVQTVTAQLPALKKIVRKRKIEIPNNVARQNIPQNDPLTAISNVVTSITPRASCTVTNSNYNNSPYFGHGHGQLPPPPGYFSNNLRQPPSNCNQNLAQNIHPGFQQVNSPGIMYNPTHGNQDYNRYNNNYHVNQNLPPLTNNNYNHLVNQNLPPLTNNNYNHPVNQNLPPLINNNYNHPVNQNLPPLINNNYNHLVNQNLPRLINNNYNRLVKQNLSPNNNSPKIRVRGDIFPNRKQ